MEKSKKENFARFGIATKGFVYCVIGVLTAMSAFGYGGQKAGSSDVLDFIAKQPFGQVLLIVMAIGLLSYVFYRMYQTFADSDNEGKDAKGVAKRVGYFISGLVYGFLAYRAVKMVIDAGSSSSGNGSFISSLLDKSYGAILVGIIALGLLAKAVYQIYKAYSGKYKENLGNAGLDSKAQSLMLKAGRVGYTARGIVIGIVSYLLFKAALTGQNQGDGKENAFDFLQNEFGTIVLGIVAIGLAAYGVFMFIKAKYPSTDLT